MKAIYPGSFDPVTSGHLDIIERTAAIYDEVIVAIAQNVEKEPCFSLEERLELLKTACGHLDNVTVDYFHGLLVNYAQKKNAKVIVKGLRAISDFEFELEMALMNKRLESSIETFFMMTNAEYSFLSSSLVKELAQFGAPLSGLVPKCVEESLIKRMSADKEAKGK